jgi:hypothetical protein
MHQQLWGYKVEEKLYVGVREQKKFEYRCIKVLQKRGSPDLITESTFYELLCTEH